MLDLISILRNYQDLENDLSKFYLWLSDIFSTDEEVSRFFSKLYMEEEQHKNIVSYQMKLVRANPIHFRNKTINGALVKKTREVLNDLMSKSNNINLELALKQALILEACTMESYFSCVFNSLSKELETLVKNMQKESLSHFEKIKGFMKKKGFEVPLIPEPSIENINELEKTLEEYFKNN